MTHIAHLLIAYIAIVVLIALSDTTRAQPRYWSCSFLFAYLIYWMLISLVILGIIEIGTQLFGYTL